MSEPSQPTILNHPIVRGLIAAAVIAAVGGAVLAVQARRGGSSGETTTADASPTPVFYGSTIYTLCPDDVGESAIANTGAPVIGQPAPDFALCDGAGALVTTLSSMKGKVVWINFWATWCVPCKKELPDIQKLYDEKSAEGLEVLLVNLQETQAKALSFLPGIGIEMPVVIDRQGKIYERYKLTGLPDSFFINREGNVGALYYGFVTEEIARDRLRMAGLD